MHTSKRIYSKEELIEIAIEKTFIGADGLVEGFEIGWSLDGATCRKYLESKGFEVIKNYDTKRNGLAITKCGIHLSSNGYLYKN